ncbi:HD domain-containing protein [Candidatus Micrarchaeota archaeon]|nr:HD domain-containing protein [Candidatus Micrarchaeota archaeon]
MLLLPNVRTGKKKARRFERFYNNAFYKWFADEYKDVHLDFETVLHSERVSWLSALMMDRVIEENLKKGNKLNERDIVFWRSVTLTSGLLHDIGKVTFPERVFRYSETLSSEEWDIIVRHPSVGASIIFEITPKEWRDEEYVQEVIRAVLAHHERWDGFLFDPNRIELRGGYPLGLRGNSIPVVARIIKVVDCYDAATTRKDSVRPDVSLKYILERSGTEYDPEIVDIFKDVYSTKIRPVLRDVIYQDIWTYLA